MKRLASHPSLIVGGLVALVAALQRLLLWRLYRPVSFGDTGSYFRSAEVLARLTLDGYDGTRVPGYPAFVALIGVDPDRVFAAQLVLGWLITILLYVWAWQTTRRTFLAAAAACAYTFVPALFLFEANLLTETMTTFLLVVSFVMLIPQERAADWVRTVSAVALGLTCGAVGLVRILFYPLTFWLIPFVWAAGDGRRRSRLLRTALFLATALLLLGGWVGYIYSAFGFLAPTTMGGYNLVQHAGVFFEYVPEEDAVLRDTYLRYREARLAARGDQTNTIWEAIPELTEVSGLGFYDLSREMQRLSLNLIIAHPDLYLRNVVVGWVDFWKAPVYWDADQAASPAVAEVLRLWAAAGRGLTLAANAAFLLLSAWVILRFRRYSDLLQDRLWLAPWGFVWLTSVVQTFADNGDNPRFLIPLQAVLFYVVIVGGDVVLRRERGRP